jgi:hypothetical protein
MIFWWTLLGVNVFWVAFVLWFTKPKDENLKTECSKYAHKYVKAETADPSDKKFTSKLKSGLSDVFVYAEISEMHFHSDDWFFFKIGHVYHKQDAVASNVWLVRPRTMFIGILSSWRYYKDVKKFEKTK